MAAMSAPLISIITVVYNRCATLPITLDSVEGQTYKQVEYIIIDGGSTDGTLELLEQRKSEFSVLISEPDEGLYDAMNKGLDRATGDFCLFLNAGDAFYTNTSLSELVSPIKDYGTYYFGTAVMTDGKHIYRLNPRKPVQGNYQIEQGLPNHQASLFPWSFYASNRYDTDFKIAADDDFKIRAIRFCPVVHINVWVVIFELGGLSRDLSRFSRVSARYADTQRLISKHFLQDRGRKWAAVKFLLKSGGIYALQLITGYHWRYEYYFNKFEKIPEGEAAKFKSTFDR